MINYLKINVKMTYSDFELSVEMKKAAFQQPLQIA